MQDVITNLPELQNGVSHWFKVLEEEMTSRILAVGDLMALLGKVVGMETMLDIFEQAGFVRNQVQTPAVDGGPFDNVRGTIWTALRALYPARPDITTLTGPPLKSDELPATYIHLQLRRWREITKRNIQLDPIMTTLFRKAIREGMPSGVGCRLDEVVGLNTMTHREFVDHVAHAVERQREEEKSWKIKLKTFKENYCAAEGAGSQRTKAPPTPEPWSSPMAPRPAVVYNFSGIPHPVAMQGTTSALQVQRKPYQSPGKNVLTSPPKKGSGYGYPNVTLSKRDTYSTDPYDRAREMMKKEIISDRTMMKGGPFRLNLHPRDCFDSNPYKLDKALPPVKHTESKKAQVVPFKPSSPSKRIGGMKAGTFDIYPSHSADPYIARRSKSVTTNKDGKIFHPSPGPKTMPVSSIINVNVKKAINSAKCTAVPSVMAY